MGLSTEQRERGHGRSILLTTGALLALLALTVTLSTLELGRFALPAAMVIAAAKTLVVAAVFMELRREPAVVRLVASAGLVWIVLLFSGTLSDVLMR